VAAMPAIVASAFLAGSAPAQGAVGDAGSAYGLAGSASAQAAVRSNTSDIPASDYGLRNYKSPSGQSYCLGVSADENDQSAVLYKCNAHADQRWQVYPVYPDKSAGGRTFWNLVNNNGSCLAVAGRSYAEDAAVYGWTCEGTDDQYWTQAGVCPNGYAALLNYNAYIHDKFYVAGVSGGVIANDRPIILFQYDNECDNQFWNWYLNIVG
jgi:Ricin-type beta-trefoil lectin domain